MDYHAVRYTLLLKLLGNITKTYKNETAPSLKSHLFSISLNQS